MEDYRDGTWEEFEEWIEKRLSATFVGEFVPTRITLQTEKWSPI